MPSKKRNYWNLGMSEWLKNILFGTKTIVVRARNKVGRFVKDDKSTPENEAWTRPVTKKDTRYSYGISSTKEFPPPGTTKYKMMVLAGEIKEK